jgi:hypothetical protein
MGQRIKVKMKRRRRAAYLERKKAQAKAAGRPLKTPARSRKEDAETTS